MKSNALLREVNKATKVLVEVIGAEDQYWLLQVDKHDLELQIIHISNGDDIETGFGAEWTKSAKGVLKLIEQ